MYSVVTKSVRSCCLAAVVDARVVGRRMYWYRWMDGWMGLCCAGAKNIWQVARLLVLKIRYYRRLADML